MQLQALQLGSGVERARGEPQVVEEQRNHQLERGTRVDTPTTYGLLHCLNQSKSALQ